MPDMSAAGVPSAKVSMVNDDTSMHVTDPLGSVASHCPLPALATTSHLPSSLKDSP